MANGCDCIPYGKVTYLLILIIILLYILIVRGRGRLQTALQEGFKNGKTAEQPLLIPQLVGGLGNNLFELCAVLGLAKKHRADFGINLKFIENSQHATNKEYFDTIFKNFRTFLTDREPILTLSEKEVAALPERLGAGGPTLLTGYYQDYRLLDPVRDQFISMLSFNEAITHKYPKLDISMFLHIRGGDYKNNPVHDLDLTSYYKRALAHTQSHSVAHYYIFTNDRPYAESFDMLANIDHTFVDEQELDSLYLMSRCRLGGIAANSSFSFWGLYLDTNRPFLIMPSKWYAQEPGTPHDYYFKGVIKIDV